MAKSVLIRKAALFGFLLAIIASGASSAIAQTFVPNPKDFESDSLLFIQQDVFPSFGQQTGVRLGTVKGLVNGNITTHFFFTVPPQPAGGPFVTDDSALIINPEGDQILFKVHSEGTVSLDTLNANINPFRAPFLATYTVEKATGNLSKYQGVVFPARGTFVISTLVFSGVAPGTPVGTVYVEVSRNPLQDISGYHLSSDQFFTDYAGNLGQYGWGGPDCYPLVWDYDGNGTTEISIYHIPTNQWFVKGVPGDNLGQFGWGGDESIPVPGDYNGDGVMERAFYHWPTNRWFIEGQDPIQFGWGGADCIPLPGTMMEMERLT